MAENSDEMVENPAMGEEEEEEDELAEEGEVLIKAKGEFPYISHRLSSLIFFSSSQNYYYEGNSPHET
jgi:hypothetical protein